MWEIRWRGLSRVKEKTFYQKVEFQEPNCFHDQFEKEKLNHISNRPFAKADNLTVEISLSQA